MSSEQLELLKVASTKVFQLAGGDASMLLHKAIPLLETVSRIGIEVKYILHPSIN